MRADLSPVRNRLALGSGFGNGLVGFLTAAYVMAGRWSPGRYISDDQPPLIIEPRLWLVIALLVIALIPVRRSGIQPAEKQRSAGRGLPLMIALFTYLLASALWAPSADTVTTKAYELILLAAATLSLHTIFRKLDAAAIVSSFWTSVIVMGGLLALAAIPATAAGGRLAVLAGGPNVFGRLMALLYVAGISRLIRSKRMLGWSVVVVLAGMLVVLSGSRGSMISVAVASMFFFAINRASFGKVFVIAALCASIGVVVFLFTPLGVAISNAVEARIGALLVDQVYTSGRDQIYADAVDLAKEHPLAGVGLGGFMPITGWVYPHNIFLELTCEGGAVALGLFLAMLAAFGCTIYRMRERVHVTSLTALVMLLVASQFSGDLYDSRAIFLLPLFVIFAEEMAPVVRRKKRRALVRPGSPAACDTRRQVS